MENDALDRRRTMLPKWRTFDASFEVFGKHTKEKIPGLKKLGWKVEESGLNHFKSFPNPSIALELMQSAQLVGDEEVIKLTSTYLEDFSLVKSPTKTERSIHISKLEEDFHQAIKYGIPLSTLTELRRYKILLNTFPCDAIAWIEMGLLYLNLGSYKNSVRCCRIACHLAPNNPFIVRSSTRCFAHIGKIDYALEILKKCRKVDSDPWLLATHISACEIAGKPQRKIKLANSIIASQHHTNFDLSELRAAIGTVEEQAGSHVKAKKFFRKALTDPTENTISQVIKMGHKSIIPDQVIDCPPPRSFEAMARIAFCNKNWDEALSASQLWLHDEQYSGRPAILSAFILQIDKSDHHSALEILGTGIRANPEDIVLKNNKVFSLACSGHTSSARALLNNIKQHESEKQYPYLDATEGLINYREGNIEIGREFYAKSIERFIETKNQSGAKSALIYQAAEELRANTTEANTHADYVLDAIGAVNDPAMLLAIQRLKRIQNEVCDSNDAAK